MFTFQSDRVDFIKLMLEANEAKGKIFDFCVTVVCASLLNSIEFGRHGYPTVYQWESTQLTVSPKELK